MNIKWFPAFAITLGMTRNTCVRLETRVSPSNLMSKPRTRSILLRNLPKTPEITSKHHGDNSEVKSSVKCIKPMKNNETRYQSRDINVLLIEHINHTNNSLEFHLDTYHFNNIEHLIKYF